MTTSRVSLAATAAPLSQRQPHLSGISAGQGGFWRPRQVARQRLSVLHGKPFLAMAARPAISSFAVAFGARADIAEQGRKRRQ